MPEYDNIGASYATTRKADPRIADALIQQLDARAGAVIADVGAGTGTYAHELAERGFTVHAVEPSSVMRSQATAHSRVHWKEGRAEALPLADSSVDGIAAVLCVHHFEDLSAAFREFARVRRAGPVVVFTFDPWLYDELWLYAYFPRLQHDARRFYPSLSNIEAALHTAGFSKAETTEFALPRDLVDRFAAAGWSTPETYLDAVVRANMSPFALMPEAELAHGLALLRADLESGRWDQTYGHLREEASAKVGYVFLRAFGPQ